MVSSLLKFPARLSFLVIAAAALLVVMGCKTSSDVTAAQAAAAGQTVMCSVSVVMNNESLWANPSGNNYTYSDSSTSMTGTHTTAFPTRTYVLSITLANFQDAATGYTVSGTIDMSNEADSVAHTASGTMTGNLTFSGGPVTTETWDVSFSGTPSSVAYAGTITCNGTTFDAGTLSLGGITQAAIAATAGHDARSYVMSKESSWTHVFPGNNYTYAGNGASMSGTRTIVGTVTTYDLTLTFLDYDDTGNTGYTVTGTIHWSMTEDSSTSESSGTATANLTLSGGQVTSQTWNISLSDPGGIGSVTTIAGTVTSNGTPFDARAFVFF